MHPCTTQIAFTIVVACYIQTLTKTLMYMQMLYLKPCYSKTCNSQASSLSILLLSFQLSSFQLSSFKLCKISTLQLSTQLSTLLTLEFSILKLQLSRDCQRNLGLCAYNRCAPHKTKKCESFASQP